ESGSLHVTVLLTATADHAVIVIVDQGSGVSAEQIDRLLRPFERGEAARSGSTGAGLGLPIVDRIARMHGGAVRLLPNIPRGLRAEMTLARYPRG
ncbi:MAG TPA: sensor histidine kinase, partial [Burkholderiaceae bacterium]|nr:sensor histidine kinase [Burkholderiaceae bacterium]